MGRREEEGGTGTAKSGRRDTYPWNGWSKAHWIWRGEWVCVVMMSSRVSSIYFGFSHCYTCVVYRVLFSLDIWKGLIEFLSHTFVSEVANVIG